MPKLIPPTMIWGLAQDILFTLSGVFCIAVPGRILELFEETLQGGSDMSLRAAGVQYRSTEEEKTKLALKTIGVAHYWSACVYVFVSQLFMFFCGVWMVGDELFVSCAAHHLSNSRCLSPIQIYLFFCCSIGEESCSPPCLTTNAKSNIHHKMMLFVHRLHSNVRKIMSLVCLWCRRMTHFSTVLWSVPIVLFPK